MKLTFFRIPTMFLSLVFSAALSAQNWATIPEAEITLFQAGQVSWEWLLIPANHGGAPAIREGRACVSCHQGEEAIIGRAVSSKPRLEPEPMSGLPAFLTLKVQAAVADDQLQLRLSWLDPETNESASDTPRDARVSVLFTDSGLPSARQVTCWASCHSDLPDMNAATMSQLTKYLPNSRTAMTRTGGAANYKDAAVLASELSSGAFLEYWTAQVIESMDAQAWDGYILESRVRNNDSAVTAEVRQVDGMWIAELKRPLTAVNGHRKALREGQTYPISFAIHMENTSGRRHLVSFPFGLTIDSRFGRIESLAP